MSPGPRPRPESEDDRVALAEAVLGYRFRDNALLRTALTHPSYSFEAGTEDRYERLEFLGDSVLGFIVTEHLYTEFPDFPEGKLAKLRAAVVSGNALASVSEEMGLSDAVFVGHGAEATGARESASVLADVFEAVAGAMMLDRGLEGTRAFVLGALLPRVVPQALAGRWHDYKSSLQEYSLASSGTMPEYRHVAQEGPPHDRTFSVEVVVGGEVAGTGAGPSKKRAEKEAARDALKSLGVVPRDEGEGPGRPG